MGADLVLHSAAKFLGSHAAALGGVICGPPDVIKQIYPFREINGAVRDPMAAYLLLRGAKTEFPGTRSSHLPCRSTRPSCPPASGLVR